MSEPGIRGMLQPRTPVDIEFSDLTYTVPDGKSGCKIILRSVNGIFKSGELTAILGPSGAGKSTLLNVLAGYRTKEAGGSVLVNGRPRDMKLFYRTSRYIMQEDLHQPGLTVFESMRFAADLKLGPKATGAQKKAMIQEIMDMLRLQKCRNTATQKLSGGEKKRLSIALELVNNPAVVFLDEPTTGLDDSASTQCLTLLKEIAKGGRTVICSIHTPSAKLFSLFDAVYILAEGQCVFQGHGEDIVHYLSKIGLDCPKTYNPADFMIEVSSGEYGDYVEKMVHYVDNGKCHRWNRLLHPYKYNRQEDDTNLNEIKSLPDYGCSPIFQFLILLKRMLLQQVKEARTLIFKTIIQIFLGIFVGCLYYKMGNDASKTIFNFGFCFVTVIDFMYLPMLPTLAWFPLEVSLLKREHFNRWYSLNAYYLAMSISKLPMQFILLWAYMLGSYTLSDQPFEISRITKFVVICLLLGEASTSFSIAISSRLNIVNGIFLGPALSVPFMLLAVYGLGTGSQDIPILIRIAMYGSYLRFGLEGLTLAIYGEKRASMICPDSVIICDLKEPRALLKHVGMENSSYWVSVLATFCYVILFKTIAYLLLKSRLRRNKKQGTLGFVGHFIKTNFNLSPPK